MSEAKRLLAACLAVGAIVCVWTPPASGEPTSWAKQIATKAIAPYLIGTPEFKAAPWSTSGCNASSYDFDFGLLTTALTKHGSDVNDAYRTLTGGKNVGGFLQPFFYFGIGRQMQPGWPAAPQGFCVSEIGRWRPASGRTPTGEPTKMPIAQAGHIGTFLFDCSVANVGQAERTRCRQWDAWASRYYGSVTSVWPVQMDGSGVTKTCYRSLFQMDKCYDSRLGAIFGPVADAAAWAGKKGVDQLVAFVVSGGAMAFDWAADIVAGGGLTTQLDNSGFVYAYNLVAGVMLGLVGLMFLIALIVALMRSGAGFGRTIVGLMAAVFGVSACGGIAFLMVQLSQQCAASLINAYQTSLNSDQVIDALKDAPAPIGIVAGLLMLLGSLALLGVMLLIQPLVYAHALLGSAASIGQVLDDSRQWLKEWFIRLTALAFTPFFIVAMWIMAVGLIVQPAQAVSATNEDLHSSLVALIGAGMMLLLPFAPWILLATFHLVDHRASQMNAAVVRGAGSAGGTALSGGAASVRGTAGGATGAVATMMTSLRRIGHGTSSATTAQTSSAPGPPDPGSQPPNPDAPLPSGDGGASASKAPAKQGNQSNTPQHAAGKPAAAAGSPASSAPGAAASPAPKAQRPPKEPTSRRTPRELSPGGDA